MRKGSAFALVGGHGLDLALQLPLNIDKHVWAERGRGPREHLIGSRRHLIGQDALHRGRRAGLERDIRPMGERSMILMQIPGVADIDDLGSPLGNGPLQGLQQFDKGRREPLIRKVEEAQLRIAKDLPCGSGIGPLLLDRGRVIGMPVGPIAGHADVHLVALVDVLGDRAAAAKHLVIHVRGDD
jgi:hypothetical protein